MNPTQADSGVGPNANPNAGYCRPGRALSQSDLRLLQDSATDPIVACERDYYTELVKARSKEKGLGALQGLTIPLRNALGEIVGYQLRPHRPLTNKKGKLVKYVSVRGSKLIIDVPWRLSQPRPHQSPETVTELAYADPVPTMRKAMIADDSVPVVITEGARKADSAVSRGLCAISLAGVSAWHRAPGWNDFPIRGRTFYLTFDSDATTKRQVWVQLSHLKAWLESRGAIVKIIDLPAGPHGQKVGLDDFIAELVLQGLSDGEVRANLLALASGELRPPPVLERNQSGQRLPWFPAKYPRSLTRPSRYCLRRISACRLFSGEVR